MIAPTTQAAYAKVEELKAQGKEVVSEVVEAAKFYRAEEYHQQYLSKGGRFGRPQSPAKGCTDKIRCYG